MDASLKIPTSEEVRTQHLQQSPGTCLGKIDKIVAEAASACEEKGMMALGAATLQKQHPHTQPYKSKKSPAPRFHAFALSVQKALRDAYSFFAAAYRIASEKLRGGDRGAIFPEGCFPPALPFCT